MPNDPSLACWALVVFFSHHIAAFHIVVVVVVNLVRIDVTSGEGPVVDPLKPVEALWQRGLVGLE